MTAEGDNRVLMQKVAKELLDRFNSGRLPAVKAEAAAPPALQASAGELARLPALIALLRRREARLLAALAVEMSTKLGAGEALFEASLCCRVLLLCCRAHSFLSVPFALAVPRACPVAASCGVLKQSIPFTRTLRCG